MEVQKDFRELFELLNDRKVDYIIVGAYDTVSVHYIGKEQFLKNKQATGRIKDLADLEALNEK